MKEYIKPSAKIYIISTTMLICASNTTVGVSSSGINSNNDLGGNNYNRGKCNDSDLDDDDEN
jgi:hypothetical protein